MGVELISVGTPAPWYTKVSPPVTRGLEGWFCLDTDISRIGFNRAPGKADAVIVGVPAVNADSARLKGLTNYLSTDVTESADMTVLVISKAVSIPDGAPATAGETTPMHFGSYSGVPALPGYPNNSYGISLFNTYPDRSNVGAARDDGTGSGITSAQTFQTETIHNWNLRVIRTGDSVTTDFINLTTNRKTSSTVTTRRVPTGNKMRIGSGYSQYSGTVDVSHIVFYSVALTDSEISQIAALMRARAARLGITV
ncbi:TPA: hypothetical protein RMM45_004235 [Escherichia coli]|nr:hypothetical protein [Escherichia coli]